MTEEKKERKTRKKKSRKVLTAVITVLIALLLIMTLAKIFPLYRITGDAMKDTLGEGDIAAAVRKASYKAGDVVVINESGKILIRRIIAGPGDSVKIGKDGNVFVNDDWVEEKYVSEKQIGEYDIEFPFTVPQGEYFVLCDNRSVYADSRNTEFGTIPAERIEAKVILRILPLKNFGGMSGR